MADEIQKKLNEAEDKLTEVKETPTAPDAPLEDVQSGTVRDARAMPVETMPDDVVPEAVQELQALETPESRDARRLQEASLNKPIEAIEEAIESLDAAPGQAAVQAEIAHHEDAPVVITLGARTFTFNTNIYTFIFAILGGLTLLEIVIAEIMPIGFFRTLPLAIASLIKALLVMAFYMHLREDNRIFAAAITLPIVIALIAILFLLTVPSIAYPY